MSARALVVASAAVALGLVAAYVALGGGRYEPPATADPCQPRPVDEPRTDAELAERLALSAIDGAACELDVSREEIVLAFASEDEQARLRERHGFDDDRVEDGLRAGLLRAVDDAERIDAIGGTTAALLRLAARTLPLELVIDRLGAALPSG